MAAIASPIDAASSGGDDGERDLAAVDEFVDDRAGSVDRDLAGEGRDGERQPRAHAGAERAQRDQVGGLLGLGALAAGDTHDPVAAVAAGEQGGVEVAVARRAEGCAPATSSPATADVASAARVRWDLAMTTG